MKFPRTAFCLICAMAFATEGVSIATAQSVETDQVSAVFADADDGVIFPEEITIDEPTLPDFYAQYVQCTECPTPALLPVGYMLSQGDPDWRWTFRPQGFLYGTYWASANEPRMAVHVVHDADQGALLDPHIGGRIGFVRFGPRNRLEGYQLDLLGGAKLRQDPEEELDVLATDFRYDIPLTYRRGPHAFKVGYYHVSSHLGDEFLLKNPNFNRLNYVRDVINFGYSYNVIPELRLYTEAGYGFNVDVSEPLEFQFGFDYGPACPTRIHGHPFVAMNVHLKEELNFGGNFAAQAGWAWRGEGLSAGVLRLGGYYYDGGSPQLSFFQQYEQQVGLGLWYDY